MKPVVLLVDDNEEILEFLSEELSEKYSILKALNGKEALDILKTEAVHLVISDVMMDIMDGFELSKIIKSDFEYSHIPVILLTAKYTLESVFTKSSAAFFNREIFINSLGVRLEMALIFRYNVGLLIFRNLARWSTSSSVFSKFWFITS